MALGLHTFTHSVKADDPPEDDYEDNREKRCVDYDRYNHSHRLPGIVREIPTCRKLYFSRTRTGLIDYTQIKQLAAVFSGAGSKSEAAWKSIMRALPEPARGVDHISRRGSVARRNKSQDSRSSSLAVASIP